MTARVTDLRAHRRQRGVAALLLIAGVFSVAVVAHLATDVLRELRNLRQAPRDNVQWSILQLQTEFQRLRIRAQQTLSADPGSESNFVLDFDVFYSRVQLLKTAPIFEPFRAAPYFAKAIASIDSLIADLTPIVDLGAEHVRAHRAVIAERLADADADIQSFVLDTIAAFAVVSDQERGRLMTLLGTLGAAAAGVLTTLLVALVALRGHTMRIERRTAELADSEERLAATVRSALDAVIVTDEQGIVIDFNEQASKCFGHSRGHAIGKNLANLVIPERMRDAHLAGMARYALTNETSIIGKRIEIDALHADGHEFPIELAVGVASLGNSRLFVAYARDITGRRIDEAALRQAKEEAQEANNAKSRSLAVMSHEMRTPLNGILGVIQLLNRTSLGDEQKRLLNVARLSGELLLDQINDVLDLTKMQAGRFELDPNPFEFSALSQTVKAIVAADATERGNALVIVQDERIPEWLVGDANRLRQILLNLVANANKFTRDGTITLSSKLIETSNGSARIEISVSDTGIGIPKERISQLFSEFGTLDNRFQRKQGGTGLGLVISRRIATLMGGTIEVESTFGKGSRFWLTVTLPIAVAESAHAPLAERLVVGIETQRPFSVLLVEDNQTNALVARALLSNAGHQVTLVSDGQDAVRAVSQTAFDLVLMDVSMPVMDGLEATRLIRALPPPHRDVPIVAMTAHAFAEDRQMILDAGMNGYLAKPIRNVALLQAVAQFAVRREEADCLAGSAHRNYPRDVPLIDDDELRQFLLDVGDALAPRLMEQFSADVQRQVESLTQAAVCDDRKAVGRAAHALAGCAATIGATRLARAAREIEAVCRDSEKWSDAAMLTAIATIQTDTLSAISARLVAISTAPDTAAKTAA